MPLPSDEKVNELARTLHGALKGAFGTPAGYRPAHARGILINGTFTPTAEAAGLSSAPHFNNPSTPVIVRFSNSTGIPTLPDNDSHADPRGLGVRFTLPEKDGRRQHTDIIAHSTPFFPARVGQDFLDLLIALGATAKHDPSAGPSPIEVFLGKTPYAAAFIAAPKPFPASFATEKYYGVNAFKFVSADGKETFVRYQITPDAGESHISNEEASSKDAAYLHNEIQTRVIDGGVSLTFWAQIAEEGDVTNDATVQWPTERKLVNLGSIKLEKVTEDNDEEQRKIIYDPIPRVQGVDVSDDPLLDVRASLYLISGRERREAGPHQ